MAERVAGGLVMLGRALMMTAILVLLAWVFFRPARCGWRLSRGLACC
jgi:hypothetical protein